MDGGVVRLHVKEGYFFAPPKRVTRHVPSVPDLHVIRLGSL